MQRSKYSLLALIFAGLTVHANPGEVTLTKDEADTLQLILKKDKMMPALVKSQEGLEALSRFLSLTITGPVKLAVQWNQAAIVGWRKAIAALVKLEKEATCNDIDLQIAGGTPNEAFFEELKKARGCDD
jgi:hypothetical protein